MISLSSSRQFPKLNLTSMRDGPRRSRVENVPGLFRFGSLGSLSRRCQYSWLMFISTLNGKRIRPPSRRPLDAGLPPHGRAPLATMGTWRHREWHWWQGSVPTFVSYTRADAAWQSRSPGRLEAAGYRDLIQVWEFRLAQTS